MASAFQGNAFQQSAFQTGTQLVAANYDLGSPSFATPALGSKYNLHALTYSLGSPAFAAPPVSSYPSGAVYHLVANPWAVGSPVFALPALRQINLVPAQPNYWLGSPVFASPGFGQTHELFANTYILGGLDFAAPDYLHNYQLSAATYDLGSPSFEPPQPPITVDVVFAAPAYWLGSPKFGYPRLQATIPAHTYYPPNYLTQVEGATNILWGVLDHLQAAIPNVVNQLSNDARALIFALRVDAESVIRGTTLGTRLQEVYTAADQAGATYAGLDATRLFIVQSIGNRTELSMMLIEAALNMTLAAECNAITRMTFTNREDARLMLVHVTEIFEQAKQIALLSNADEIYENILALGGATINWLAQTQLELPRFLGFDARASFPSLYLAQRIYADPTRYAEIEAENNVVHPAFCPAQLRVLSNAGY
jgi:hypothetical protein